MADTPRKSRKKKKYTNPPIQEAVCEFTFDPDPLADFLTLPGKLHSHLQKEYPAKPREQPLQTIVANQTAGQPSVSFQSELFRVQFPTQDGKRLVSVGRNTLAVSALRPYPGWDEEFKGSVKRALAAYYEVAQPPSVVRIGVRYINRIVVPGAAVNPRIYFRNIDRDDQLFKGTMGNFMKRIEYAVAGPTKIVVTHATLIPEVVNTTDFLLDIDTVWDSRPLTQPAEILAKTEQLHDQAGDIFEALITDKARKLFDAA